MIHRHMHILARLLLSVLGLVLYVPSATLVCVSLAAWSAFLATPQIAIPVAFALPIGCALLSFAAPAGSRLRYAVALAVVPVSGAFAYRLLFALIANDKAAVTLGILFAGLTMWLTARGVLLLFPRARPPDGGA